MDGKKDQDALNHKVKDLNEIRDSKYLGHMLPTHSHILSRHH